MSQVPPPRPPIQGLFVDPFGRARLLLEESYGLGRDAAIAALETNAEAKAIHDCAIAVIARLINDGTR